MCKKVIAWSIASILILGAGGYYGFWYSQSKKLETLIINSIKKFDDTLKNTNTTIKYDKLERSGFPYKVEFKIKKLDVETTKKIVKTADGADLTNTKEENPTMQNPDLNDMSNTDIRKDNNTAKVIPDENPDNINTVDAVSKIFVDKLDIKSDVMLKKFEIKNEGLIKFEDEKNEISSFDYNPEIKIEFYKSPLSLLISESIMENIKELEYKDDGYKTFDKIGKTTQESDSKNYVKIEHDIKDKKNNLYVNVNLDNKAKLNNLNAEKAKTDKELALEKALYSKLKFEFKLSDIKNLKENVKLDVEHLDWDMQDNTLHVDGSFHFKKSDMIPFGLGNILINNYREFFRTLCNMSNNPDGKTDCNFLKKLLPETANEIDEHSLKIIYNREEGNPTIIGKKNLEEVLSDYYAFMKKL